MASTRYRYFIGTTQVYPTNADTQQLQYKQNETGGVVFDIDLDGDVIFPSAGAFDFKNAETQNLCDELAFKIEERCNSEWAIIWEGIFSVSEGNFDDSLCTFTVKPRKKLYLLDDIDVNILDVFEKLKGTLITGVVTGSGASQRIYENGKPFADVLLFVAQRSNPKIASVISNLFQINPVAGPGFPGLGPNDWTAMAFCSLSDVQEPIPSNLATTENIKFRDLMSDIQVLFDAFWFIDSNYNLRVEHSTFFNGVPGLDLTTSDYEKFMRGSEKYSYNLNDFPKEEIWKIVEHEQSASVTYGGLADIGKDRSSKQYETKAIRTDYRRIRFGGANSANDGLFLFATDGGVGTGGNQFSMLEDNFGQNGALMPSELVQTFHIYTRPSLYGLLVARNTNPLYTISGGIVMQDTKPIKEQKEFSVPICCSAFDSKNQITTSLGLGYLWQATVKLKTGMMSLQLKYKITNCGDITPTDLDGCSLWLKYNTGLTMSGTNVSQWDDQSGNARHAAQANPTNQPQYIFSGEVTFADDTGSQRYNLITPAFQMFPSKRGTVFILLSNNALDLPTGYMNVLSNMDGSASTFYDVSLASSSNKYISNVASALFPVNGVQDRPYGLYVIRRIADDKYKCRLNSIDCIDNPMIIPNTQPTSLAQFIGYNPNNANVSGIASFGLCELIVYDRDLSDKEVEQIELYLTKAGPYNNFYP